MARPRDIRRLALQTLFQIDVRGDGDLESVRASADAFAEEGSIQYSPADREKAFDAALASYQHRREADRVVAELAPTWPAHRQPAVDRAILRLAIFEMHHAEVNPKIVVNEAVELAKEFSTDRSPAFINGVLDKVLKRVLQSGAEPASEAAPAQESPTPP